MNIEDVEYTSSLSFDELLKRGEIHDALEIRLEQLEAQAGQNCAEIEAAKVASAALVVTGFVLATPVTAVFAGAGAIAYLYSVASDYHQTHRFALFPLVRTGIGDLLSGVGLAATGNQVREDRDDIARAESYLSPREAKEYRLLVQSPDRVSKWLLEQPAEKRAIAYRSLTRNLGIKQLSTSQASTPVADANQALPHKAEATSAIGCATKLGAVEVPVSPAGQSAPSLNMNDESTKGFDWHRLNTAYNDFPHLFLLGKSGAGKSYVSDRLVRFLEGYCIVISPKRMPTDFQGLQVVGLPYDYRAIHRALVALERLMVEREAEMQRTGNTDFQPINVILDELPVSSSGCKDLDLDLLKPLKALIRAGRTSKIRLIILAQGAEVKALGIEGEGGLRDSLTYVYLKGFVEDYAAKNKIDISQVDRPCIIDGQIADTSFLAQFIDTYPAGLDLTGQAATPSNRSNKLPKTASTAEDLNRMFNLPAADHEVEEDAIETVSALPAVQSTFPHWKPKSQDVAAKIIDWMTERPDKTFSPSEVKKSIRLLKDDATLTADRVKKLLDLLTEKQFLSTDEAGRYSISQLSQQTDDYDF